MKNVWVRKINYKLMVNKSLILIYFILLGLTTHSQEYFNEHFEFDNPMVSDGGFSILEVDDGYIVNGVGGDSLNINWFRWGLAKFNYNGEFMWGKSWGDTIKESYFEKHGSLIKVNDSYIALGTMNSFYGEGRHTETVLVKINNSFDTVWTANYGKLELPQDSSYYGRDFVLTDSGFAICGTLEINYGLKHFPFLLLLDSIGDFISINYYPASNYIYLANTIIQTKDNGFVIGAHKYHVVGDGYKGNAYILKTDSLGNQEWQLKLDGDYINGTALVCNSIDSCIVAASKFDTDSVFYNKNKSNIRVTKVDYNGNIIWDKTYTEGKLYSDVTGISNDNDNGFIISGFIGETVHEVEPDVMGFMLKINNDGDSIWYRQYSIFEGYLSDNRLYYPIATSDGGYIAVGTGRPHPPDEGTTDAWILKVDSMGCVNFNDCWVGINENNIIDKEEISGIKVFPNPAETYFYIDFNSDKLRTSDNICTVFNLHGSKIMEFLITNDHQKINCSNWKKGIYFIKVSNKESLIGSTKVLIY